MDQKLIILISDNSKNKEFQTSLSCNFINSTKIPWNMTKKIFCRCRTRIPLYEDNVATFR
jgi:hypothetical protein